MKNNKHRFQGISSFIIICFLIITAFLVSCGSGGGGGDNGSDGVDAEFKAVISGSVVLPSYSPAGRLWIEIEDLDTKDTLYKGATEIDGSFSVSIANSKEEDKILIQAIAPENPEALAMALVDLKGTASSRQVASKSQANQKALKEKNYSVSVNSRTTAEVVVLSAAGALKDLVPFSPEEKKIIEDIASDLEKNGAQFCSANPESNETDPVSYEGDLKPILTIRYSSGHSLPVRKNFDEILQSQGLQAAQQDAYNTIWAGNRGDAGFGWANGWVSHTRTMIKAIVPELTKDGLTEHEAYVMKSSDLERIADIIMSEGYGNCRENAFVGAYIASRLKKFKQVAVMQIFKGGYVYNSSHAVALACEEGAETYDIAKWRFTTITDSKSPLSAGILGANCTIIDPWNNETLPLDQFLDKKIGYLVNDLMPIKLEDDATRVSNKSTSNIQIDSQFVLSARTAGTRPECSFGSPPDACSVFVMPGVEMCDNGINDDTDLLTDCDDPDCANDDACNVVIKYVVWLHEDSRTCCSGDFDGVAPYQYHGTVEEQVDQGAIVLNTFDSSVEMSDWTCTRTVHRAYNWISHWAELRGYIVTNLPCESNADYM